MEPITREAALEILRQRHWDATSVMGFVWTVGPVVDGIIEARGHGSTLEDAVQNAMEAER